MPYGGFSNVGSVDIESILIGPWIEILAESGGTDYQIGVVQDGTLEVSREYYRHIGNTWPKLVDKIFPVSTGMKFTGNLEEMNAQNVSMMIGQGLNVGNQNYLYIGVLSTPTYFTLRGRRIRDSDSFQLEFAVWKCMVMSLFQLGASDEAVPSPYEVEGLDDTAGGYGGSASAPLGFLYIPTKTP